MKIKRNVMISDYEQGGLKTVHVMIFTKALKSTWDKNYFDHSNRKGNL